MGANVRPTGVLRYNQDTNQLLLDPNFDALFLGTNLFVVETADLNLADIASYQVLLVENTTSTWSWWKYSYDLDTGIWTNIDSDDTIGLAGIKAMIATMPVNSQNSPVSDTEVTTIKAMLGIV